MFYCRCILYFVFPFMYLWTLGSPRSFDEAKLQEDDSGSTVCMMGRGAERTADRKQGCLWRIKARHQESGKWEGAVSEQA